MNSLKLCENRTHRFWPIKQRRNVHDAEHNEGNHSAPEGNNKNVNGVVSTI